MGFWQFGTNSQIWLFFPRPIRLWISRATIHFFKIILFSQTFCLTKAYNFFHKVALVAPVDGPMRSRVQRVLRLRLMSLSGLKRLMSPSLRNDRVLSPNIPNWTKNSLLLDTAIALFHQCTYLIIRLPNCIIEVTVFLCVLCFIKWLILRKT